MKLKNNLYFYPENGGGDCNTYVIRGSPGVLIDPGWPQFLPVLLKELDKDGIDPGEIGTIANTHLHLDHSWSDDAFRKVSGASITLHPLQKQFYDVSFIQVARYFGVQPEDFSEDNCFENNRFNAGDMNFELLHLPGHSPDSIGYYCSREKILICGDVVFDRSTGRADLPGGNADQLKRTIEQLSQLDVEYLLPGHMNMVSGVDEVANNFKYIKETVLAWL